MKQGVSGELIPSFPIQDVPQPLHHRDRSLSRPPRHRRQLRSRIPATGRRFDDVEPQGSAGSDVVGRRANLGHDSEGGTTRGTRFSGPARKHRSWGSWHGTGSPSTNESGAEQESRPGYCEWLDLPAAQRPTFLTLYFSDIDSAGHDFGPESRAVADAARRVDRYLNRLMRGLDADADCRIESTW